MHSVDEAICITPGTSAQLLEQTEYTVTVSAKGDSLDDLVGKLFQKMRKQVFAEFGKPIIQMEATEFFFDEVDIEETIEHFMLVFWPRTKTSYEAKARIVLNVKYLNINERN